MRAPSLIHLVGCVAVLRLVAGQAIAEPSPAIEQAAPEREVAIGLGLGGVLLTGEDLTEVAVPLHLRARMGRLGLEVGRDSFEWDDALGMLAFGIYRAGVLLYPLERGPVQPYAYGRLAYLLAGSEDDEPHVWNVGGLYAAGAGIEWRAGGGVGLFAEAGALGDFGGDFVAPAGSAGVTVQLF